MQLRPQESVESFAELVARLDDPFADRDQVMARADLDERGLQALYARWGTRLQDDGEAVQRFARTYARARGAQSAPAALAADHDPRFLSQVAQPWRDDAAAVSIAVSGDAPPLSGTSAATSAAPRTHREPERFAGWDRADETAELRLDPTESTLPFQPGARRLSVALAPTEAQPAPKPRQDPTDETIELRVFVRRPDLPFEREDDEGDGDETLLPLPKKP